MKCFMWVIIFYMYQLLSRPSLWLIFKIVVKNDSHCNPPCLGSDFSHYLSFRAASAPPSPVKCVCACASIWSLPLKERAGGHECCASTRLSLPFFLTGSDPLLSPQQLCWPAGSRSSVAFPAQEEPTSTRGFFCCCVGLCACEMVFYWKGKSSRELVQPVP